MFSFQERAQQLNGISQTDYDLVIIGGGITGCGIALDAASRETGRNLKILLLEKGDFANGTSSRSTKLIHGGLRYLKNFEFKLVYEVGREREILHQNARHLVLAEKMLLPILKAGSLGKFTTGIGLRLYDFLAGVKYEERRKMLNKEETIREEKLLKRAPIIGGGLYYEYRTDDARLTMDVLKTACLKYQATALNYARVEQFIYDSERKITGLEFTDVISNTCYQVKSKMIINATGPWVDTLRSSDQSLQGKHIQHSKGVHLVFAHRDIPLKHAIYFDLPDKRMMFAIPRNECTYIGTTDTFYKDSIDQPIIIKEDIDYLLNGINQMLENGNVRKEMILSMWSGVRPLIYEEGKNASELSRRDEVLISPSGLISIAGGKLTGYRAMAEEVVDLVMDGLALNLAKCATKSIKLFGGNFETENDASLCLEGFIEIGLKLGLDQNTTTKLFHKFGTEIKSVFLYFSDIKVKYTFPLLAAELIYCIQHEQCYSLGDFYIRRSGYLYFERGLISPASVMESSDILKEYLNLSDEELLRQQEELKTELEQTDWKFYYSSIDK